MSVDTRNNENMCKRYRMTARTAPAGRVLIGLCAMTGLLLGSFAAQATPVTVNLGQSAEDFVEHGLGPDISTGRGTYAFDQGNCLFDGTNTTCTLSGAFTGTTSGFTAGSYTFVTEYGGTGLSPIRGMSTVENPNLFSYLSPFPSSTSMTLNLFTTGGHVVEPLVTGGFSTATALGLNFTYVTYACSGVAVATCTPGAVGLTNGAIGQGPTTAIVTFDNPVPPTTTTTTLPTGLPTGPCGGIPLEPPSFASIDCRLALLLADVNDASGLGTYQAKLAKNVTKARSRATDGGTLCGQSNVKKTKKRLLQAAKAMSQFVHRLNGSAAKRKLDATLRRRFVADGTLVQSDLKAFRATVASEPSLVPSHVRIHPDLGHGEGIRFRSSRIDRE
jgi:hypothetical protein